MAVASVPNSASQGSPAWPWHTLGSAEVRGETCKEFYTRASHGHLDLLPRGSARRSGLLRRALTCLGVRSSHLNPEQLSSLGALVCDMESETITASDPSILENLKLCSALTEAQRDALNTLLLAGDTVYGDPSSWHLQELQGLGPLLLALDQSTLSLVPKEAREALGRSIMATYSSQGRSQRERSLLLLRALGAPPAPSHPRHKRNTDSCPAVPITSNTVSDPDLVLNYWNSEEFELCLSTQVVEADLARLLQQPLPTGFLLVVKKRLQQLYPMGIPEGQLKVLGELSHLYTPEEISQWELTSSDTLQALLNSSDGSWDAPQLQELVSRYLALGGMWSGALLQSMGGKNLCQLLEEQVGQIPPEALRTAGQLDISSCSQARKEQLYRKAQEAFAGHTNTTRTYFCLIQPYLGGAPAEDLKALAEAGIAIDMDMDTFLALNPAELEKLSVMDVKNLLGQNLQALKEAENETLVMSWVKKQSQRELDLILGIGLQGGILQPPPTGTATTPPPSPTASVTPKHTVPTAATTTALSSHPTAVPSTAPTQVPTTPGSTAPHPYTIGPSASGSPTATSTPTPLPTTTSTPPPTPPPPCSSSPPHHSTTSHKVTSPPGTLLNTTANPNTTSPSSIPSPALTQEPTSSTLPNPTVATHPTSTPLVSMSPPAPGGTTPPTPATQHTTTPRTHNVPGTLVPNSTAAPAATTASEPNPTPAKPTPVPSSTLSTQNSSVPSTAKTTTEDCRTGAPPTPPGPSSTTTTTEPAPAVPEPPRPTPNGYINLKPQPGSGSMLSSCLVAILTTALGSSLLPVLL
ncbi:mesothelin-like protein [Indicator indicator]|uniref:mesothelin-like protein n=1 Tax=Indicator indicator TaxID=1002788 RepID=UPI0023DF196D|nr:mesothelin-like protein [Indicator indicator]